MDRRRVGAIARAFSLKRAIAAVAVATCLCVGIAPARADFGGVSFWLPGLMGSLAATPSQPGWTWMSMYIHLSGEAGGNKTFQRGGAFVAGLQSRADFVASGPVYVFAPPILGGQLSVAMFGAYGRAAADIAATVTGPLGNTISGHRSDALSGPADLFWQTALKWNQGVDNYMVYMTGNFPTAPFNPDRLINIGFGHWAVDGGAGYTYLNPQTGYEFSVVAGMTYNFVNPSIDYKNGIDFHVDWGASKFIAKDWHVGIVGYAFQQLTGDSGSGALLGDFKGRVFGIGPQIGHMFQAWEGYSGYVNLKGYKEFGAENRPEGWNVWVTLVFSPAPRETAEAATRARFVK